MKQQKQAHREGVKKGQDLFEWFMLKPCLNLVKENNSWGIPDTFEHPPRLEIVNVKLPKNYMKLDLNVSVGSLAEETQSLMKIVMKRSVKTFYKIIQQCTMRYLKLGRLNLRIK